MTDITNPIITIVAPLPGSVDNSNTSTIEAIVTDGYGSGVNLASIDVTINGTYGIKNGVVQAGFTGFVGYVNLTQVRVSVQRTQPYLSLQSVNVSISAQDVSNNPAASRVYSFITEDNSGAIIINSVPPRAATQVVPNTEIFFNIRRLPRETDLRIDTLRVGLRNLARDVDGTPLRDGYGNPVLDGYGLPKEAIFIQPGAPYDERQVNIVADADKLGYGVTIIPLFPLPPASVIDISIAILDEAGNLTQDNYSFTTVDDTAPTVINPQPFPNSQANSIATPISFSIGDRASSFLGSGVDLSTLDVTVDNQEAIRNGVVQLGFSGTIDPNISINGYDIVLARTTLFTPRKSINVSIGAADFSGNLFRTNFTFGTEDVTPPQIQFTYPQDGATNIPQDATIILNIHSEVAVEEIDINSITLRVNGITAFENNTFATNASGTLSASSAKTLTIALRTSDLFLLGSTIQVAATARDVFGNLTQANIQFTVTTQLALETSSLPLGGIYYKTNNIFGSSSSFNPVGSALQVSLIANRTSANIYYTLDGSTPSIDNTLVPQGTTRLYSVPLKLPSIEGLAQVKYFAVDTTTNEREPVRTSAYFFTRCPEEEQWRSTALQQGLEYTATPKLNGAQYTRSVITTQPPQIVGTASYVHDLGRICYVDELLFNTSGLSHFRMRLADTLSMLSSTPWCNQLLNLTSGQHISLQDGYTTTIRALGDLIRIEGRKRTFGAFNDEALATINQSLSKSFTVATDMRLAVSVPSIVGAKSFLRLRDDVSTLEIQQIVSKINAAAVNAQLADQSSIIGESVQVFVDGYSIFEPGFGEGYAIIGADNYEFVTDGKRGYTTLFPPPSSATEELRFSYSKTLPINEDLVLEDDTTSIYNVNSISPAIYNKFAYEASERQRIVFTRTPTNGSFRLLVGSEITSAITYDTTAIDIQNALNSLSTLSTVTVTGDAVLGFDILFSGADGGKNQPLLEVVENTLRQNFKSVDVLIQLVNQGGVAYSSALIARVFYRSFARADKNCFTIGVANQPVDDTLARVQSLLLDARSDMYIAAETNNVFRKQVLLEEGDYNFKFRIVYNTAQGSKTRIIGNPFIFRTRQNLSTVQAGDVLVVGAQRYVLESAIQLPSNEFVLEFQERFPTQPDDILAWSVQRDNTTLITSLYKIAVLNPLQASVAFDAEGAIGNIVVSSRRYVEFEYFSTTAENVFILATFNDFNPIKDPLIEQADSRPISKIFDRNNTTEYQNNHINYHKVRVEPITPIVVDRVRFYTHTPTAEKQRVRLQLNEQPTAKAEYLARKANGTVADYILEGYGTTSDSLSAISSVLHGLPDLVATDTAPTTPPLITYATDLHTSIADGYVEWKYVQVGITKNRTLRSSIELLSRLDSYSGASRRHVELEIYSLPSIPQPIADFVAPIGSTVLQRLNKSGFAASSNNVTVSYARRQTLTQIPVKLHSLEDNGVVNNFHYAVIEAAGPSLKQVYTDMPQIFRLNQSVIVYDPITEEIVRTRIVNIATDQTGLVELADPVPQQGRIVKDYIIHEEDNSFKVTLEVPDFQLVFGATIFKYTANPDNTAEIEFENPLGTDATLLLGAQMTYPTMEGVAKILSARNENIIVGGPVAFTTGSGEDPQPIGSDERGQIITAVSGRVQEIQVDVTRFAPGVSVGTLQAKIYAVAPDGFTPVGAPLGSSAGTAFSVASNDFQKIVLPFTSPVVLSSVETYAIVWSGTGLGYPTGIRYSNATTYADGLTISRSGSTWTSSSAGNFVFSIVTLPADPTDISYQLKPFIVVTIDRLLPLVHPSLGCFVEAFNATKQVVDYEISKTDGSAIFHNESQLGSGLARLHYEYVPIPYPAPEQMWSFEVLDPSNVLEITVIPTQYQIFLKEISKLAVDFFDGVSAQAPLYVDFIVNNTYTYTTTYASSTIIDGYEQDYDPSEPTTGNIREFAVDMTNMISLDGYGDELFTALTIRFTGNTKYSIGELQSIVRTQTLNSQCRIMLNDLEIFKSPVPVGAFSRYRVQVEPGLVLVYFNGSQILRYPLVLQNPTVQLGGTAKSYDDTILAEFKNIAIDQFYTTSPAKIMQTGRYVEIEGTVIS